MEIWSIFFESFLIILLIGAIFYGFILDKRLKAFHQNRHTLDVLIARLSKSLERAETAMKNLQEMSKDTGNTLQQHLTQGHQLQEELVFLTERADYLAEKLSGSITQSRNLPPVSSHLKDPDSAFPLFTQPSLETVSTPAQRDLLKNLGNLR